MQCEIGLGHLGEAVRLCATVIQKKTKEERKLKSVHSLGKAKDVTYCRVMKSCFSALFPLAFICYTTTTSTRELITHPFTASNSISFNNLRTDKGEIFLSYFALWKVLNPLSPNFRIEFLAKE